MIDIFCDDESHTGRVVKVAVFVPVRDTWVIQTQTLGEAGAKTLARTKAIHARILEGNPTGESESADRAFGAHDKYTLRCEMCGLDVQRRAEATHPVLDRIAAAGVSSLSLSGLAAILS